MSGQYRTFDQTSDNIKKFIDMNSADVYCHLWSTDEREINYLVDKLKPKKYLSENNLKYVDTFESIEQRILHNNPKVPNQDRLAGNASMNYSRKIAFDMVPKEEYDTVIYCRYDIGFEQLFNFSNVNKIIVPLAESYNLISDIFAIMPMKMATKIGFRPNKYNASAQINSTIRSESESITLPCFVARFLAIATCPSTPSSTVL